MHIQHTRLLVHRFAECFRFYRDVLGFTVTWGDEQDSYASFADSNEDGPALAIFRRQAMAEVVGTEKLPADAFCQDRFMLIVYSENVDTTVKELRDGGAEFELAPRDFPDWGIRAAYLRDPDGNLVEISGELDRSKWSDGLRAGAQKYDAA
jgi:catechol 2,3-dioxygenase-like lactoylglutathione lyase family enzyme